MEGAIRTVHARGEEFTCQPHWRHQPIDVVLAGTNARPAMFWVVFIPSSAEVNNEQDLYFLSPRAPHGVYLGW
jgi:hypothetical protein